MPTQQSMAAVMTEARRLAGIRLEVTARERHQQETVDTLAALLRKERKILKGLQAEKRKAEDLEEAHRAGHDLEPG